MAPVVPGLSSDEDGIDNTAIQPENKKITTKKKVLYIKKKANQPLSSANPLFARMITSHASDKAAAPDIQLRV